MNSKLSRDGFTIVELLIVIVVIAILAAITIVAYNGLQNRASNSVVQSDLTSAAKQLEIYRTTEGRYPNTGQLSSVGLKMAKQSYLTSNNAVAYCSDNNGTTWAIIGKSKSGVTHYVSHTKSHATVFPNSFPRGIAEICPEAGSSNEAGMWIHSTSGGWASVVSG